MKAFFVCIIVIAVGGYGLYRLAYPEATIRYRMTLEVETPQGLKTGSSVIELKRWHRPRLMGQTARGNRVRGQAVHVDLGDRGHLFGLLTGRTPKGAPGSPSHVMMVLNSSAPDYRTHVPGASDTVLRQLPSRRTKVDLAAKDIPFLVRFRDLKNPLSVESVDPKNLSDSFGPDVFLKRASLELVDPGIWPLNLMGVTGTPLTTEIETVLPWLPGLRGRGLDGNRIETVRSSNRLANSIRAGFFSTERF